MQVINRRESLQGAIDVCRSNHQSWKNTNIFVRVMQHIIVCISRLQRTQISEAMVNFENHTWQNYITLCHQP